MDDTTQNPYQPPSTAASEEQAEDLYHIAKRAAAGTPYPPEAFVFLAQGFDFAQRHIQHERDNPHDVDAVDLSWCLHDYAVERFWENAQVQLEEWNIRSTRDFGAMVYRFVEIEILASQPNESVDDFNDVFDFAEQFNVAEFRSKFIVEDDQD